MAAALRDRQEATAREYVPRAELRTQAEAQARELEALRVLHAAESLAAQEVSPHRTTRHRGRFCRWI
eukprot:COSAG01_NODE_26598_length_708_cov_3.060755_2_plen_67_part_00